MIKKIIALLVVVGGLLAVTSLPASARYRGDYYYDHHRHYRSYDRHYYRDRRGADLATGLVLGTALGIMTNPPQQTVVYQQPQQVVVQQPRVCVEERTVSGEYQVVNGQRMWVSFPYPVKKQFQVQCY